MIIDAHAHVFPNHAGASGYKDAKTHLMIQQNDIKLFWGKFVSSETDEKYIPFPGEDVNFRVGKYGRYYWTKHGKEVWLQRFPTIMMEAEWSPEHMIAFMDSIGADMAVLQAMYMESNYCSKYFSECVKKWPKRFIGTVTADYDIEKGEECRESEIKRLNDSVRKSRMKGVFQAYPREQKPDDEKFYPLWEEISKLKAPHIFFTGFQPKEKYLDSIDRIVKVLKKFPDLNAIIGHLGGNVRVRGDPNFTDTPKELFPYLTLPNAYFEVGYVLAFENRKIWGKNYEYPYPVHTKIIKAIYDEVGAERLLWGSDMPYIYRTCTYRQCLDLVRLHFDFLSEEEKNLVLGGNATKLFRI